MKISFCAFYQFLPCCFVRSLMHIPLFFSWICDVGFYHFCLFLSWWNCTDFAILWNIIKLWLVARVSTSSVKFDRYSYSLQSIFRFCSFFALCMSVWLYLFWGSFQVVAFFNACIKSKHQFVLIWFVLKESNKSVSCSWMCIFCDGVRIKMCNKQSGIYLTVQSTVNKMHTYADILYTNP